MRMSSLAAAALLVVSGCSDEQPDRTSAAPSADSAAPVAAVSDSAAVAAAVQSFYDRYLVVSSGVGVPWLTIAREQPAPIDPALVQVLRADSAARASSDEMVGLDFDPFLNSQDPCPKYEVGAVTKSADGYSVGVHAVCDGKRNADPDVAVEVRRAGDGWQLVNFRYPAMNSDLLAILAENPTP